MQTEQNEPRCVRKYENKKRKQIPFHNEKQN